MSEEIKYGLKEFNTMSPEPDNTTTETIETAVGDDVLYVLETYPAVQGEGLLAGAPTVFVRLAGCTVGCHYCDTKYSWKVRRGDIHTPEDLAAKAATMAKPFNRLALTGGEPLEHPWPLVKRFLRTALITHKQHVTIETSGVFMPDVTRNDWADFWRHVPLGQLLWSVAPKLTMAKANYPFPDLADWVDVMRITQSPVQLKFVVATPHDIDEVAVRLLNAIRQCSDEILNMALILQPATLYNEKTPPLEVAAGIIALTQMVQEYVLSSSNDAARVFSQFKHFYIKPQLHAILYGAKRQI